MLVLVVLLLGWNEDDDDDDDAYPIRFTLSQDLDTASRPEKEQLVRSCGDECASMMRSAHLIDATIMSCRQVLIFARLHFHMVHVGSVDRYSLVLDRQASFQAHPPPGRVAIRAQ